MPSPILGIDLGTTNSVVAMIRNGQLVLLTDDQGGHLFPSTVTKGDANTIWVGKEAVALAAAVPGRTVSAAKRLIGRRYEDAVVQRAREMYPYKIIENPSDPGVLIKLGEFEYRPEEISSLVLRDLIELAANQFGFVPEDAIITVPAYFNHNQREATQRAAKDAGLNVLRLLNEPTAAALSLPSTGDQEQVAAVYDFGGGTFDVSIIRIQGKVYEVLATNGDTFLGGDDIDGLLCDDLAAAFDQQTGVTVRSFPLAWHRLKDGAEKAKQELSFSERCSIFLPRLVAENALATEVTRARLDELVSPLIERSLEICERTLKDAGLSKEQVHQVILVGGQTRMPLIRDMVAKFFGKEPAAGVDPDTTVAEGAAREGAQLREGQGALLLDVIPITLGINIFGNRMYPLIQRNTKVPVRREHTFTTSRDAQTRVRLAILQGDSEVASENARLGEIVIEQLKSTERFQNKVSVVFEVDSSGILHVKALDEETRQEKELTLNNAGDQAKAEQGQSMPEAEALAPKGGLPSPVISGFFRRTELTDVICFLHANNKTGRVEVKTRTHKGTLHLLDGDFAAAEYDGTSGAEAVSSLVALEDGFYAFFDGVAPEGPRQIEAGQFEQLIQVGLPK